MNVRGLIDALSKMDPDKEVIAFCENRCSDHPLDDEKPFLEIGKYVYVNVNEYVDIDDPDDDYGEDDEEDEDEEAPEGGKFPRLVSSATMKDGTIIDRWEF